MLRRLLAIVSHRRPPAMCERALELVELYAAQPICEMSGRRPAAVDLVDDGLANCPVCPGQLDDAGAMIHNRARSLGADGCFGRHRVAILGQPIIAEEFVDRHLAAVREPS